MDIKELKTLLKMVTDTDITEFELSSGETSVKLKRGAGHVMAVPVAAPVMTQAAAFSQAPQPAQAPVTPAVPQPEAESGQQVTSPIVGTFYRAPAPDVAPYVEVGSLVEKGQTLCIVEAMKLMNEIEAEFRCRIVKICKENAQPVEFGDTLFIVEPA
jgi:acetyl-CoA carboxylase biotin carboxyl carrier protein